MRRPLVALAAGLVLAGAVATPAVAAVPEEPGCEVAAATLEWGFKESFRAYVDGAIANGSWEVGDGAAYETPSFVFSGGEGRFGDEATVTFPGSIRFTGHGGILDTTVEWPVLQRDGDGTFLFLDVSGPTMTGDPVDIRAAFVAIDLTGQDLVPVDGIVTIDAAPTTLTQQGAAAFPNYPAGEPFDPVTITLDVGDCGALAEPAPAPDPEPDVDPGAIGNATPWVVLVGALAVVLAVLVVILIVTRRRP
jgi:hypothetical protein